MTDRSGQRLGNYQILRLLGQGSFAEVYLGEHIYLHTRAAIKILRERLFHQDVENFLTEARTIASLIHPNIVRILDFDVQGNTPCTISSPMMRLLVKSGLLHGRPIASVSPLEATIIRFAYGKQAQHLQGSQPIVISLLLKQANS